MQVVELRCYDEKCELLRTVKVVKCVNYDLKVDKYTSYGREDYCVQELLRFALSPQLQNQSCDD